LRCSVVQRESVEKLRCGQRQSGTRWHGSDEGGGASMSIGLQMYSRARKRLAGATDRMDWRSESVAWICGAIADALFCTGLLSRGYDRM